VAHQGVLNLDAMKSGVLNSIGRLLTDFVPKSWATCWELVNAVSPANSTLPSGVLHGILLTFRDDSPSRAAGWEIARNVSVSCPQQQQRHEPAAAVQRAACAPNGASVEPQRPSRGTTSAAAIL